MYRYSNLMLLSKFLADIIKVSFAHSLESVTDVLFDKLLHLVEGLATLSGSSDFRQGSRLGISRNLLHIRWGDEAKVWPTVRLQEGCQERKGGQSWIIRKLGNC
jgi:hypothetical protein